MPISEPIAIIGSACHFANVSTPSELWSLLKDPQDVRREIPADRFSANGFYHGRHSQAGHTNVRHAYMMSEDISAFDAEFFGLKPIEAKAIDPQQRWLLETVYEVRFVFKRYTFVINHVLIMQSYFRHLSQLASPYIE